MAVTIEPPALKPGLRERKKRQAQRAIRTAALRLFLAHGYPAVSVEQIAADANVSRTTFFNYFASKEAVLLDPDPDLVEQWERLWLSRPADEARWQSLTVLLLRCMEDLADWLRTIKKLKATPGPAPALHTANSPISGLDAWVVDQAPAEQRAEARLQLAVAQSALIAAFEQWDGEQPFETYLSTARAYLDRLACAFPSGQPESVFSGV
jgi:AcrR family transcriptional regulator